MSTTETVNSGDNILSFAKIGNLETHEDTI